MPCSPRTSSKLFPRPSKPSASVDCVLSRSETQTRRLGERLGRRAVPGDLYCLFGPMGSGKTTFVQGFAAGAGFKGSVVSPTFALVRQYKTRRLNIHHLDLYRLRDAELGNLGLEEYWSDPKGICLIEWPGVSLKELPSRRIEIVFSHVSRRGENCFRRIRVKDFVKRAAPR